MAQLVMHLLSSEEPSSVPSTHKGKLGTVLHIISETVAIGSLGLSGQLVDEIQAQ